MIINVLASGSGGNATLLEIGSKRLLIDAGLSYRQIISRLASLGKSLPTLDYVFLTHEHSDHVTGLLTIQSRLKPLIYMTEGTFKNLPLRMTDNLDKARVVLINYREPLLLDGFSVSAFLAYHDALEPCGFRFTEAGRSLVYLTDTGYFPHRSYDLIRNADAYMLESNHEPELLLESDRPWLLKKRILDDQGHLSNEDSAHLLTSVLGEQTGTIVLAHLSEECNTKEAALKTYAKVFHNQGLRLSDYRVYCADQDVPLEAIEI